MRDFSGLIWLNDRGDVADDQPAYVQRYPGLAYMSGPERTWCLELERGRVVRAWLEVEFEGDLRYSLELEPWNGAWRPAGRDTGKWRRGAAPRALLPPRERVVKPGGEPVAPTWEQLRAVRTDHLLPSFGAVLADLATLDADGLAAMVTRSGFTAPRSRRGRRRLEIDVERAERLYRGVGSWEQVPAAYGVDDHDSEAWLRTLHRRRRERAIRPDM